MYCAEQFLQDEIMPSHSYPITLSPLNIGGRNISVAMCIENMFLL